MLDATTAFWTFVAAMGAWESGISERMQAAEREERQGDEGRTIMSEYNAIMRRHCTAALIADPERMRMNLHYREPSPYRFVELETAELGLTTSCFHCYDQRFESLGERFLFHMRAIDGIWLVEMQEYVPADETPPFPMAV